MPLPNLRKAQQRMFELRPYADRMSAVLSGLAGGAESEIHPLLAVRPRKNGDFIVLTSDRGSAAPLILIY